MEEKNDINGLPVPKIILELIEKGHWKLPDDKTAFKEIFGEFGNDAQLHSLQTMVRENGQLWLNEKDPIFLGFKDEKILPGNIDPNLALIIGDLGIGYDQPIALDYRANKANPSVLTLLWKGNPVTDNRWVVIAKDLTTFLMKIGVISP